MGAFEFGNVTLAVSGSLAPGGAITVTTTGAAGMDVLLAVGMPGPELLIPPLGGVFFGISEAVQYDVGFRILLFIFASSKHGQ